MENETVNCPNNTKINTYCSCPKTDCPRHGLCCECVHTHKNRVTEPIIKRFPHCLRDLVQEAIAEG